jgi:hypothetical protein
MFLGLCRETWQTIAAVATAIATLLAVVGLVAAWVTVRQNTLAREFQLFEAIFRDVRQLDKEFITSFAMMTPEQKTAWSASFFNTVEYLCFMVNRKLIRNSDLRLFFISSGALRAWKSMFDQHVAEKILGDGPTAFSELKKATTGLRL